MRSTFRCLLALATVTTVAHAPLAAAAPRITTLNVPTVTDTVAPPESTSVLRFIEVCPALACGTGRSPCTGESLLVRMGGAFPNDCWFVRSVDLYTSPTDTSSNPWVRLIIDYGDCPGRACNPGPIEWEQRIVIPPRPAGTQTLNVALIELHCGQGIPPPPWPLREAGFGVGACDSTTTGCFLANWYHPDGKECDLRLAPGETGTVDFTLRTAVGLEGLQGKFELYPSGPSPGTSSGLRVTNVEPIGPAVGMRLAWSPKENGAEFVLFSDGAAHIPATPSNAEPFRLLRVSVASRTGTPMPPRNRLYATDLLGSTSEGKEVRACPSMIMTPDMAILEPSASICTGGGCDINRDASTDVRDLVMMVHCLTESAPCDFYDCNGDSITNVDDVMCCALKILRINPCRSVDGCGPDSTPQRPDPNVRVEVGVPIETANGAKVPIHISGADRVGAARLALRIPADRWRPVSLTTPDAAWLTVFSQEKGEAVMGAIRISPVLARNGDLAQHNGELDLTLALEPVDPANAGGELGGLTADLSGTDGVRLIVPIDSPMRALPGPTVELSENRPDPFSGETRFTLSMPAAGDVDLGVFDLSGRRVATLHKGTLAAGVTEFSWNGRGAGGTRVGGGVYFYRAVSGTRTMTKRMVYLGGR